MQDQRQVLQSFGAQMQSGSAVRAAFICQLKKDTGGKYIKPQQVCNPFGGAEACQELPADSAFASVCSQHDRKVGFEG